LGQANFVSAWVRKGRFGESSIRIGRAEAFDPAELEGWSFARADTDASTAKPAWKHQLRERLAPLSAQEADGAVEMHIAYALSAKRNWCWPWKATIDALGSILGIPNPLHPYNTNDDRITQLAFHRNIDDGIGWTMQIGIWWRFLE